MGEDALGHGAAADVAVADEKYFNHKFLLSQNAKKCPVLQGFTRVPGTHIILFICHTLCPILAYRGTSFPCVVVKS